MSTASNHLPLGLRTGLLLSVCLSVLSWATFVLLTVVPVLYCRNLNLWNSALLIPQRMYIATCVIAVCVEEELVSAYWRWRDSTTESCRKHIEQSKAKKYGIGLFFCVNWVVYLMLVLCFATRTDERNFTQCYLGSWIFYRGGFLEFCRILCTWSRRILEIW